MIKGMAIALAVVGGWLLVMLASTGVALLMCRLIGGDVNVANWVFTICLVASGGYALAIGCMAQYERW